MRNLREVFEGYRNLRGWSWGQVAREVGLDESEFSKVLNGYGAYSSVATILIWLVRANDTKLEKDAETTQSGSYLGRGMSQDRL